MLAICLGSAYLQFKQNLLNNTAAINLRVCPISTQQEACTVSVYPFNNFLISHKKKKIPLTTNDIGNKCPQLDIKTTLTFPENIFETKKYSRQAK